ncbi:MAG TPA: FAD-binding oxidoreductase [Nocardioidaceae bacterium]|nr:FAD-binding oxidoreductase [Nocardioidaceae bacterium]
MTTTNPTPAAIGIESLAAAVRGPVLAGDDPRAAGEITTFNLAVTHRPAVVVGATSAEDVAAAVAWAARRRLPVAVQSTGHGPVRAADGAVLVTTSRMQGVTVDPVRRTATAAAGARWADVVAATAPHGLAPLSGSSSQVGVVGYTLGGGMGCLSREHGFAADHVHGVELVTADGRVRRVDDHSDPDLFWAVRGGKGNFGIVTALEFGLVPVSELYAGSVFFTGGSAAAVLHAFRAWAPTLPEQASTSVALMRLPDFEELPAPLRGQFVVSLRFAWTGDPAEGERLLAPMLAAGEVLIAGVGPMPYSQADMIHQDPTEPMPAWERGRLLRELPEEAVDTLLAVAGPDVEIPLAMVEMRLMGGAMARQPRVPNAVSGRDAAFSLFMVGPLVPGLEDVVPMAGNGLVEAMSPWLTGTGQLNFLGDALTPEAVAEAWAPETHRRLLEVKEQVDPDNVFCHGHALVARA